MDVKYIPADWEKMRAGLSDLLAQGFGAGLFDHLKDVNEVLEDAERDIAKYDVDGAISFHHTSQKSIYNSLSDDFSVLHRFTGKVRDIVDRTIDEPFYKDMDAFVQAVRDLSISTYTTDNRIGAKETANYGYGATATQVEVPKTEVSIDDLMSGGNFYADQMKQEYDDWKTVNPNQKLSEDEYRMAAVNMRAFEYESIRDQQDNKEFWVGIASLVVIVGVSLVCPPAGIALGAAYGVMEVSSAVSGKDWVSGRELSTSERWTRGLLAPLDIIPAAGAVSKFAKGAKLAQLTGHMGQLGEGVRTAGATIAAGTQRVRYLANSASTFATTRLRSATNAINDAKNVAVNKVARDLVDVGRAVDTGITWTKNNLNLGRQAVTPEGFIFKETFENKHTYENNLKDFLSRFEGINLKSAGTGNVHRSEIDEVIKNDYDINGNLTNRSIVPKGYESVEDFLKVVDDTTIKEYGYDSIEEFKEVVGHVEDYLNVSPKNNIVNKGLAGGKHVKGVDYDVLGFPIFKGDDVKFSLKLQESLFKTTDDKQFKECTKLLREAIEQGEVSKDLFTSKQLAQINAGKSRIQGLTWHHHQVPGKMQLVISKVHDVNHLGGNKLWGDGIR